ncbi:MAG: lasso peptide biosynthesis B2 protein [Bacteroidetes bacterium]|nr:lasso peptide biosynthesis B2 protein [Bacteroidota bacterium]
MVQKKIGAADIWYFLVATVFLYLCQLLVLFVPFRWYIPLFTDKSNRTYRKITVERILIVRKALLRGLHYLPWNGKCLVQALTGKLLLKILHLPGTIYLGVAREGGRLKAHAWLKSGNQFICGKDGNKKHTVVQEIF